MVTRNEVVETYLALLGRTPESEQIIDGHCSTHENVTGLISSILASDEYQARRALLLRPAASLPEASTFTRDQLLKIYNDLLRRRPEDEVVIAAHLAAHRSAEEFERVVRSSEEYLALQTFSKKRKVSWNELDAELDAIRRAADKDPASYQQALTDFWLDIPPVEASPDSVEYMHWVMDTYKKIAKRATYEISNETTECDLDLHVRTPVPYSGCDAKAIGDMLMGVGHVIHAMDLAPRSSILELGFGWGNTTTHLAMAGYRVTGIDIAPNFVEMVRRRLQALGLTAELRAGSFFDVESLDSQFDAVLFFECFHHCADHVRLLKALPRILKPGGKLVLAGETINNALPYPWGINPDSQAIYCIREFGWLELCFRENYLIQLLERLGWVVKKHNFINAIGVTFVAIREAH